ncbi:MAG: FAD-dependent monooxygenase, partial [Telluria sp.]
MYSASTILPLRTLRPAPSIAPRPVNSTVRPYPAQPLHARIVDRFSKGPVFLVGDAAHITPPFVGQGLVAGLRDVANLSWKLAWVLRGHADQS